MRLADKAHLFPLSSENTTYTPASELPPVIRYRGWNIRIIVCYDLRFPVWTRNTPDNLYDLLLIPSNWPVSRVKPYKLLLSARGEKIGILRWAATAQVPTNTATTPPE